MSAIPPCWGAAAAISWIAFQNDAFCKETEAKRSLNLSELRTWVTMQGHIEHEPPFSVLFNEVKRALEEALRAGKLRSWATVNGQGRLTEISPGEWRRFELTCHGKPGMSAEVISRSAEPPIYLTDIQIPIEELKAVWPDHETQMQVQALQHGSIKARRQDAAKMLLPPGKPVKHMDIVRQLEVDTTLGGRETIRKAIREIVNQHNAALPGRTKSKR